MTQDILRELGYLALGSRLKRLGERLQADVQQASADAGLPIPAGLFPPLAALHWRGPLTVNGLAALMGLSQPGITRSIARLERLGLVRTSRGSGDRREKRVELSEEGERLAARAERELWPAVGAAVGRMCARLDGPFLEQVDAVEDALAEKPLQLRIAEEKS